jgi:hypothetical protein
MSPHTQRRVLHRGAQGAARRPIVSSCLPGTSTSDSLLTSATSADSGVFLDIPLHPIRYQLPVVTGHHLIHRMHVYEHPHVRGGHEQPVAFQQFYARYLFSVSSGSLTAGASMPTGPKPRPTRWRVFDRAVFFEWLRLFFHQVSTRLRFLSRSYEANYNKEHDCWYSDAVCVQHVVCDAPGENGGC